MPKCARPFPTVFNHPTVRLCVPAPELATLARVLSPSTPTCPRSPWTHIRQLAPRGGLRYLLRSFTPPKSYTLLHCFIQFRDSITATKRSPCSTGSTRPTPKTRRNNISGYGHRSYLHSPFHCCAQRANAIAVSCTTSHYSANVIPAILCDRLAETVTPIHTLLTLSTGPLLRELETSFGMVDVDGRMSMGDAGHVDPVATQCTSSPHPFSFRQSFLRTGMGSSDPYSQLTTLSTAQSVAEAVTPFVVVTQLG
ncbi:hypothetical protein EDB89DRAFT_141101 [Lactarius sanguifluus]|nr:hypothetical protein EDB89DRAFT_141101 [Lactarius sanguifluus]